MEKSSKLRKDGKVDGRTKVKERKKATYQISKEEFARYDKQKRNYIRTNHPERLLRVDSEEYDDAVELLKEENKQLKADIEQHKIDNNELMNEYIKIFKLFDIDLDNCDDPYEALKQYKNNVNNSHTKEKKHTDNKGNSSITSTNKLKGKSSIGKKKESEAAAIEAQNYLNKVKQNNTLKSISNQDNSINKNIESNMSIPKYNIDRVVIFSKEALQNMDKVRVNYISLYGKPKEELTFKVLSCNSSVKPNYYTLIAPNDITFETSEHNIETYNV